MKNELDVLVVGGGAAGLGAARKLHDAGVDVLIVEARARVGGRSWTVLTDRGGALDLGCGWLHSGDVNPWTAIAEAQGRTVDRSPAPWERRPLPCSMSADEHDSFRRANDRFHRRLGMLSGSSDQPVSDALEAAERWNGLISAVTTYVCGAEPARVSAQDLAAYEDSGVNWRPRDGYGAVIADYGRDLPVVLNCPVTAIDHRGRRLRVETSRGTIEAEVVIVTIPSALIAEGAIAFTPALPGKAEAAQGLPLGLADKLYLGLEDAEEFAPDSRVFGRIDRVATAAYHIRPLGRAVIEAYFGGTFAAELETGGEAAFFEAAKSELGGVFGAKFTSRISPLAMHLWRNDPFARGSYSYAAPGRAGDRARLAETVDGRLFFAGEACSRASYSTAHGALLTGLAAADGAIAALKASRPAS